jgi:hypothetical protein
VKLFGTSGSLKTSVFAILAFLLVHPAAAQEPETPDAATSIWDALGDLAEEVEQFESGEPPDYGPVRLVTSGGAYPPGRFTGICRHYSHPSPYKNGDQWTNISVQTKFRRQRDGEWDAVGQILSGMYVGEYTECTNEDYLWLGDPADPLRGPGQYKMIVEGYEETISFSNNMTHSRGRKEIHQEIAFVIVEEPGECANAGVVITRPYDHYKISYDDSADGRLEFEAQAMVSPVDCAKDVVWSAGAIGDIEATIEPQTGDNVRISYKGLPEHNDDFGPLQISARVLGAGENREILTFFDGTAKNHPGEGSGETPNWFYYWEQTQANGGIEAHYVSSMPDCGGGIPAARYVFDDDRLYLSDKVVDSYCVRRNGVEAQGSAGIDCYAELVRHENHHRVELRSWWPVEYGLVTLNPPNCDDSITNAFKKFNGIDSDLDQVPDYIEDELNATRLCDKDNKTSCSGRPLHLTPSVRDVEMNAYDVGWLWQRGDADAEDWSECGQQWGKC